VQLRNRKEHNAGWLVKPSIVEVYYAVGYWESLTQKLNKERVSTVYSAGGEYEGGWANLDCSSELAISL
jgi:hypothetical protein